MLTDTVELTGSEQELLVTAEVTDIMVLVLLTEVKSCFLADVVGLLVTHKDCVVKVGELTATEGELIEAELPLSA